MKSVTLRDIKQGYRGLKKLAQAYAKNGNYDSAIRYIGHCVTVASQFNWRYADDELEELLDRISQSKIDRGLTVGFQAIEDNWVFFDDYCTSYVLALQWLRALSKTGKNILYITTELSFDGGKDKSILEDIKQLPHLVVDVVPDGSEIERSNYIYKSIIRFRASKVVMHKAMNSLIQLPLCVLPEEIEVYNINLGDQFFWLGVRHIDYIIEFRPFGASVSIQRRGFKKEQLLMVPFYPANENRLFEGFPSECNGKLVIFSGGDYYKTWDKEGTYWYLVEEILKRHKDVAFLYAIKSNPKNTTRVDEFIKKNHFEGRFVYIERRQDIYQVFSHCDIYMGTSPISGSLMSQLAAINEKPILQYYAPGTPDDETEQALCINDKFKISFDSTEEFLEEADKLIRSAEYRKEQGARLKTAMMQPNQFEEVAKQTMLTNVSQFPIETKEIDYHLIENRWYMLEECGFTNVGVYIRSLLGKKHCIRYAPCLFVKVFLHRLGIY